MLFLTPGQALISAPETSIGCQGAPRRHVVTEEPRVVFQERRGRGTDISGQQQESFVYAEQRGYALTLCLLLVVSPNVAIRRQRAI